MEHSRIYITGKYNLIFSYIGLAACVVFIVVTLLVIAAEFIPGSGGSLLPLIPLALAFGCYRSVRNTVIFIEDKKIVVKGVFNTSIYDISEFKEVAREWWGLGNSFWIHFNNGKSFPFYPKAFGTLLYIPLIDKDPIAGKINDLINGMK
jgi:hypothetical protein